MRFYQRLMAEMREAIVASRFVAWKAEFYGEYGEPGGDARSADAIEKAADDGE